MTSSIELEEGMRHKTIRRNLIQNMEYGQKADFFDSFISTIALKLSPVCRIGSLSFETT